MPTVLCASCKPVAVRHVASFNASCLQLYWCLIHTSYYLTYFILISASQRVEKHRGGQFLHTTLTHDLFVYIRPPPLAPPIFCDAVLFRCFPRRFVTDVSSFLVSTVHLFCKIWCFHCVECQNWPALWNTTTRSLVGGGGVLLLTVGIFHRPAASGILYDSSSRNATFFEKSQCFILFLCKLKLMGFWSGKTVVYLVHRKLVYLVHRKL
jgi:hypothetical protein